ncbi:helix-turn-helix domain-containing protein [Kineosporia succinea]|uniref:helix-turn-helix domain-containing protein n=1 Tax=Kineosporia succinea TaxID=84632 RepID=UPI00351FCBB5
MTAITELYGSDSPVERVAAEVRGHAAKRGLRQVDLASALGLTQGQISMRLRGKTPFTLVEIYSLAEVFMVSPAELLPPMPMPNGARMQNSPVRAADADPTGQMLPPLDLNQQPCD